MAKMCMSSAEEEDSTARDVHLPADIDWEMLNKSRFFLLGAALFSGVSAMLYPIVVVKTRRQVAQSRISCLKLAFSVIRHEGPGGLYRGFGTSLMGTIPARGLYMTALEITKSKVGTATLNLGFPEPTASAIANAAAGLSAAMAAQLIWTPIDVVSQRLMVQVGDPNSPNPRRYMGGVDMFRKILNMDGPKGLYRGFGISIVTYAPSNAVWWATYSVAQRLIWGFINGGNKEAAQRDSKTVMAVQGASAAMAGGVSAVLTMPLDTIKTRLQVLECRGGATIRQTLRNLVKEGGWLSCYRGLGPRCASMSMSAATMITTYEFLKRLSAKNPGGLAA